MERRLLLTEGKICMFGTWTLVNWSFFQTMFQSGVWELQKRLSLTLVLCYKLQHRGFLYLPAPQHDLFPLFHIRYNTLCLKVRIKQSLAHPP